MTCDILIISCGKHSAWLKNCLKSINKYALGFRNCVIVVPTRDIAVLHPIITQANSESKVEKFFIGKPAVEDGNGHLWQQLQKCQAFAFTDAQLVLHMDSDHLMMKPTWPKDFMWRKKPVILMTPYAELNGVPWKEPTERAIGHSVTHEFMRRAGAMYWLYTHVDACNHLEAVHKVPVKQFIMSRKPIGGVGCDFSEFNYLGAFAYRYQPEGYVFRESKAVLNGATVDGDKSEQIIYQAWTHATPDDPRYKADIERILNA